MMRRAPDILATCLIRCFLLFQGSGRCLFLLLLLLLLLLFADVVHTLK